MTRFASAAAFALLSASFASAAGQYFQSTAFANNGAVRTSWLTAAGVAAPDFVEDFESFAVGTDINGDPLAGGATFTAGSTSATAGGVVQSSPSFFGSSNPIGTRGLAMIESGSASNIVTFASPVTYFAGYHADTGGGTLIVTYVGGATENYTLTGNGTDGNTAIFFGIYNNDRPGIVSVNLNNVTGGDGQWMLDNFEFGGTPVPEPATMAALGLGVAALLRRRSRRV